MDKKSAFFRIVKPKINDLKLEIGNYNIHYINQADRNDPIWAESTTWGTPEDLEDAEAGTYVVRIGNEAGQVSEIYFRVGATQPPAGDPVPVVTFMNGTTEFAKVDTVDGKATLPATNPTLAAEEGYVATGYTFTEWVTVSTVDDKEVLTPFTADTVVETDTTVYPKFKALIDDNDLIYGDVNGDGRIRAADNSFVYDYIKKISDPENLSGKNISALSDAICGDVNGDGRIRAADNSFVYDYIKRISDPENLSGNLVYVVND